MIVLDDCIKTDCYEFKDLTVKNKDADYVVLYNKDGSVLYESQSITRRAAAKEAIEAGIDLSNVAYEPNELHWLRGCGIELATISSRNNITYSYLDYLWDTYLKGNPKREFGGLGL